MLRDHVEKFFIGQDYNCAESLFLAANEYYGLGMTAEDSKLISAFGAGMGCGRTCGALAGAMSILGKIKIEGRAHATGNYGELCAGLVSAFQEQLGSTDCEKIKPEYRRDDVRCLPAVQAAADVLEKYLKEIEKGL